MSGIKVEKVGSVMEVSGEVEKLTLSLDIDKLLELQDKYTQLQCECMRLYELVQDRIKGVMGCHIAFDNDYLADIAKAVEYSLKSIDIKEALQNLKDNEQQD